MKILLINIDSKMPNLALKKIEKFHIDRGDMVVWDQPLWCDWADLIYVSCVFTENRENAEVWEAHGAIIGGSGYDLSVRLPEEIEQIEPHINLGFTTRGCVRVCDFCIVPEKEGKISVVGDLLSLWDGKARATITLLDNNILAVPDHFDKICWQSISLKLKLDFTQGLDYRLLTRKIAPLLHKISHVEYHFAFDDPFAEAEVGSAIDLLKEHRINRSVWYVLVGYNTPFEDDIARLEFLKSKGQRAFVTRYHKSRGNLLLGRWVNQHHIFAKMTFREFMGIERERKYYKKYKLEIKSYLGNYLEV